MDRFVISILACLLLSEINQVAESIDTCFDGPLMCTGSRYRTIDGSCNNLKHPTWGTPNTPYDRLLPPNYADGIKSPPVSVTGNPLPLARKISYTIFKDMPIDDPIWTLNLMIWGQIITHDTSLAIGSRQGQAESMHCCSPDGKLLQDSKTDKCDSILIPKGDPFYTQFKIECLNFVRTATDIDLGCNKGDTPARQLSGVTAWMDASFVYGSTDAMAHGLRTFSGGKLLIDVRDGRTWPPPATNRTNSCPGQAQDKACYRFGDVRGNQNTQLTLLQMLFLREHNRIATQLRKINPHWSDETLYQEVRRIVIAVYQQISYYEYLPIMLGTDIMVKCGLIQDPNSPKKGYVDDYNPDIPPFTFIEHASAGFRIIHSAIQGHFDMYTEKRVDIKSNRFSDYLNAPGFIEEKDNMDTLTRGLNTQSMEVIDRWYTKEITQYLFKGEKLFGTDLRSTDIQRGRDHGLASYNAIREFCGLPKAHKFQDFTDVIDAKAVEELAELYESPKDVEFSVAAALENNAEDALIGPTAVCVALKTFYSKRVSDRFFFEQPNSPNTFTPEQLNEIRKATVSRLLCDNADNIKTMQPKGFFKISKTNRLVSCTDYKKIPEINLKFWKDSRRA